MSATDGDSELEIRDEIHDKLKGVYKRQKARLKGN